MVHGLLEKATHFRERPAPLELIPGAHALTLDRMSADWALDHFSTTRTEEPFVNLP